MPNPLKLKMFICKLLTFWIIPSKNRKYYRDMLFYFSYLDYIRFKNANYHIVSLGNSCLTRALAVATGIKPRRFYGEKSCPFDLCISNLEWIIELIENDFSNFFNNINLNVFLHDEKLTIEQFKNRYNKRIQNFLDIQKSDKKVYYIYSNYSTVPDTKDINRLYEILKTKRNGKPFKLIILTKEQINVPNVIQIPYDIKIAGPNIIGTIVNMYAQNNRFCEYVDYMQQKLNSIIVD